MNQPLSEIYEEYEYEDLKVPKIPTAFWIGIGFLLWFAAVTLRGINLFTEGSVTSGPMIEIATWVFLASVAVFLLALASFFFVTVRFRNRIRAWAEDRYGVEITKKEAAVLARPVSPFLLGHRFTSRKSFIVSTGSYGQYVLSYDIADEEWKLQDEHYNEIAEVDPYHGDEELMWLEVVAQTLEQQHGLWRLNPDSGVTIAARDSEGNDIEVFWLSEYDAKATIEDMGLEEDDITFITKNQFSTNVVPRLWLENKGMVISSEAKDYTFNSIKWFYYLMKLPFPEFVKTYRESKSRVEDNILAVVPEEKNTYRPFKYSLIATIISALVIGAGMFYNVAVEFLALGVMFAVLTVFGLSSVGRTLNNRVVSDRSLAYLQKSVSKWAKARYDLSLTREQVEILTTPSNEMSSNAFISEPITLTGPNGEYTLRLAQAEYKFILVDEDLDEITSFFHNDHVGRAEKMVSGLKENGGVYMIVNSEGGILPGAITVNSYNFIAPLFWTSQLEAEMFARGIMPSLKNEEDEELDYEIKFLDFQQLITNFLPKILEATKYVGINWELCQTRIVEDTQQFINIILEAERGQTVDSE